MCKAKEHGDDNTCWVCVPRQAECSLCLRSSCISGHNLCLLQYISHMYCPPVSRQPVDTGTAPRNFEGATLVAMSRPGKRVARYSVDARPDALLREGRPRRHVAAQGTTRPRRETLAERGNDAFTWLQKSGASVDSKARRNNIVLGIAAALELDLEGRGAVRGRQHRDLRGIPRRAWGGRWPFE